MTASNSEPARPSRPRTTSILTTIGLFVVAIGWAGLLAGPGTFAMLMRAIHRALPIDWSLDGVAVSENLVVTGFGLAILGAVQSGFRALNAFFEAVLRRSAAPKPDRSTIEPPQPPAPPPPPKPDPNRVLERGRVKGRPYLAFADGSVEVETLLGARRFVSLDEARDFIGP